jgi:allantoate deiminase
MLGIECVAALNAADKRLPFAIEVIAFGDEEGSRFPAPMLTSRAVAGTFDPASLAVVGRDGVTVGQALADNHFPPERFADSARAPGSAIAYLEAHIEQGPALEAEGLAVGIVTGIAAQLRYRVVIEGMAGHAGTTSMVLRRDALAAAAEAVLAVERIGSAGPDDLVATVGRLDVTPGAVNVIPGHVDFSLDIRALDHAVRDTAAQAIITELKTIAARRGVGLVAKQVHQLSACPCDPKLMGLLAAATAEEGLPERRLVSGAGHDAMVMASLCPAAMLFIRCAGGISHNPAEAVKAADVEIALKVMLGFIQNLGETFDA